MSETMQDVLTIYRLLIRMLRFSDDLVSSLQNHSLIGSIVELDFSYSCAAVDQISTDLKCRAVPLR